MPFILDKLQAWESEIYNLDLAEVDLVVSNAPNVDHLGNCLTNNA